MQLQLSLNATVLWKADYAHVGFYSTQLYFYMNKKWEKKRKSMITTCKIIVWNAGYKETLVMKINYEIHVD